MPEFLLSVGIEMHPVGPNQLTGGIDDAGSGIQVRNIPYSVKELPIRKKRAKKKEPRPANDGRFVDQGEDEHQEVADDPIN